MQLTTTERNSRLSIISTAVGSGGTLKVYTGSAPGIGNAPSGTLLCTLTSVVLASPSGGTMAMSATPDSSAAASGTPGYYRIATSGGTVEVEGPAGVGTGELSFTTTVSSGGTVTLVSGTFTEGNA